MMNKSFYLCHCLRLHHDSQEPEAAIQIVPPVRKQREMNANSQLALLLHL